MTLKTIVRVVEIIGDNTLFFSLLGSLVLFAHKLLLNGDVSWWEVILPAMLGVPLGLFGPPAFIAIYVYRRARRGGPV